MSGSGDPHAGPSYKPNNHHHTATSPRRPSSQLAAPAGSRSMGLPRRPHHSPRDDPNWRDQPYSGTGGTARGTDTWIANDQAGDTDGEERELGELAPSPKTRRRTGLAAKYRHGRSSGGKHDGPDPEGYVRRKRRRLSTSSLDEDSAQGKGGHHRGVVGRGRGGYETYRSRPERAEDRSRSRSRSKSRTRRNLRRSTRRPASLPYPRCGSEDSRTSRRSIWSESEAADSDSGARGKYMVKLDKDEMERAIERFSTTLSAMLTSQSTLALATSHHSRMSSFSSTFTSSTRRPPLPPTLLATNAPAQAPAPAEGSTAHPALVSAQAAVSAAQAALDTRTKEAQGAFVRLMEMCLAAPITTAPAAPASETSADGAEGRKGGGLGELRDRVAKLEEMGHRGHRGHRGHKGVESHDYREDADGRSAPAALEPALQPGPTIARTGIAQPGSLTGPTQASSLIGPATAPAATSASTAPSTAPTSATNPLSKTASTTLKPSLRHLLNTLISRVDTIQSSSEEWDERFSYLEAHMAEREADAVACALMGIRKGDARGGRWVPGAAEYGAGAEMGVEADAVEGRGLGLGAIAGKKGGWEGLEDERDPEGVLRGLRDGQGDGEVRREGAEAGDGAEQAEAQSTKGTLAGDLAETGDMSIDMDEAQVLDALGASATMSSNPAPNAKPPKSPKQGAIAPLPSGLPAGTNSSAVIGVGSGGAAEQAERLRAQVDKLTAEMDAMREQLAVLLADRNKSERSDPTTGSAGFDALGTGSTDGQAQGSEEKGSQSSDVARRVREEVEKDLSGIVKREMQRTIKLFNSSRCRSSPAPSSGSAGAGTVGAGGGGLGSTAEAPDGQSKTHGNATVDGGARAANTDADAGSTASMSSNAFNSIATNSTIVNDAVASVLASAGSDGLSQEVVLATLAGGTASPVIPTKISQTPVFPTSSKGNHPHSSAAPHTTTTHTRASPSSTNLPSLPSLPYRSPTTSTIPLPTSDIAIPDPRAARPTSPTIPTAHPLLTHLPSVQALTAPQGIPASTTSRMMSTLNNTDLQAIAKLLLDANVKIDVAGAIAAWAFRVYGRDTGAWEEEIWRRSRLGFRLKEGEGSSAKGLHELGAQSQKQVQGQSSGQIKGQGQGPIQARQTDRWAPPQTYSSGNTAAAASTSSVRPGLHGHHSTSPNMKRNSPVLPQVASASSPPIFGQQALSPAPHPPSMQSYRHPSSLQAPKLVRSVSTGSSHPSVPSEGGTGLGNGASAVYGFSGSGSSSFGQPSMPSSAGAASSTPNLAQRIGNGSNKSTYVPSQPIGFAAYTAPVSPQIHTTPSASTPIHPSPAGTPSQPSGAEVQNTSGISALHARITSRPADGPDLVSPGGSSLRDRITPSAAPNGLTGQPTMGGNEEAGARQGRQREEIMDIESDGQWGGP